MIKSSNAKSVTASSSLSNRILTRQQLRSVGGAAGGGLDFDLPKSGGGGAIPPYTNPPNNNNG
jgi:hypothetical protein